jgi:putative PIN family toxin of toxin-antitoxin system
LRDVFDTGVIVRSVISPRSHSALALEAAASKDTILLSPATIAELGEVLGRVKFDRYAPLSVRTKLFARLVAIAERIEPADALKACRDPKDDMILDLAVSGRADRIVACDKDLLVLDPFQGIRIVTPEAFLEMP